MTDLAGTTVSFEEDEGKRQPRTVGGNIVVGAYCQGKQYFSVVPEKFKEMVQLDVSDFTKNLKGADYLNFARALYLMKLNFPTLITEFARTNDYDDINGRGHPYFDIDEGERGTLIGVYLRETTTGAVSQIHWFPVMGHAKGQMKPAELEADARAINDNMARATAKLVAMVTGIGFNLFLRLTDIELEIAEGSTEPYIDDEEEDEEELEPVSSRRRRAAPVDDDEEEEEEEPVNTRRRSRAAVVEDDEEEEEPVSRRRRSTRPVEEEEEIEEEVTPSRRGTRNSMGRSRLPVRGR